MLFFQEIDVTVQRVRLTWSSPEESSRKLRKTSKRRQKGTSETENQSFWPCNVCNNRLAPALTSTPRYSRTKSFLLHGGKYSASAVELGSFLPFTCAVWLLVCASLIWWVPSVVGVCRYQFSCVTWLRILMRKLAWYQSFSEIISTLNLSLCATVHLSWSLCILVATVSDGPSGNVELAKFSGVFEEYTCALEGRRL